jgi:predicted DNA repair protein MutK
MAGATLLALLDDITSALDDIATMTKVATRKTAGVLGDDLALNAHQVSGMAADRELPIVWAVAKGSLANKAILVPAALALSAFAAWAVIPLLVAGALYLCYEGAEKLVHAVLARRAPPASSPATTPSDPDTADVDPAAVERSRIRGAIRTDFILSAEIIVITLGTAATATFATRLGVLVAVALSMTVFVYGLVAGIVKLDDAGLALLRRPGRGAWRRTQRAVGRRIVGAAPALMRLLSVLGTVAMFLVGGGILMHAIHTLDDAISGLAAAASEAGGPGPALGLLLPSVTSAAIGLAAGLLLVAAHAGLQRGRSAIQARASTTDAPSD